MSDKRIEELEARIKDLETGKDSKILNRAENRLRIWLLDREAKKSLDVERAVEDAAEIEKRRKALYAKHGVKL